MRKRKKFVPEATRTIVPRNDLSQWFGFAAKKHPKKFVEKISTWHPDDEFCHQSEDGTGCQPTHRSAVMMMMMKLKLDMHLDSKILPFASSLLSFFFLLRRDFLHSRPDKPNVNRIFFNRRSSVRGSVVEFYWGRLIIIKPENITEERGFIQRTFC